MVIIIYGHNLCSIFVYKNAIEVTRTLAGGDVEQFIEKDKIVADLHEKNYIMDGKK